MVVFYLVLAVAGALIPYGAFLPWLLSNGLDIPLLYEQATANQISIFAWLDVVIAAIALLAFIIVDGKRHVVRGKSLAIVATFAVGVSCGLPLYLFFKEKQRTSTPIQPPH